MHGDPMPFGLMVFGGMGLIAASERDGENEDAAEERANAFVRPNRPSGVSM